jgi:septal ring factor EnvC (AmiA/AmiB activator)
MKNNILALTKSSLKDVSKDIEKELASENVDMIRDYIKGAYRFRQDLEKQIEALNEQVATIETAIKETEKSGDLKAIKDVKVPARFLSEKTVRMAGLEWDQ